MKAWAFVFLLVASRVLAAESTSTASIAINTLGIDLLCKIGKPDENALLSPYSIQTALAMAYAGADGVTRDEMQRALHFPKDEVEVHRSFAALQRMLGEIVHRSADIAERSKQYGLTNDPTTISVANRLFGQKGYDFRPAFLSQLKDDYAAPFEPLDFKKNSNGATKCINDWVDEQTRHRVQGIIPDGALNDLTRLVLVNALYFKAAWADPFEVGTTKPRPFHVSDAKPVEVATMNQQHSFGYAKREGFTAVTLPYDSEIQFLILLPDSVKGLAALESKLNWVVLLECANLPERDVILFLPRFEVQSQALRLSEALQSHGIKTAFDKPRGSANFNRIAPRRPDDYLAISEVFHKAWMKLDEKGTEAAAATAVFLYSLGGASEAPPKPIEVHVDHPFVFAIQHRPSGACLFLGHVVDPR